jgi:hypothetical protein
VICSCCSEVSFSMVHCMRNGVRPAVAGIRLQLWTAPAVEGAGAGKRCGEDSASQEGTRGEVCARMLQLASESCVVCSLPFEATG